MNQPNAQYNLARADALSVRVATRVRARIFAAFMQEFTPTSHETLLDVGVTSDQSYASSNYIETLYPYKSQITAAGIDDASFLERLYPGLKFTFANALDLPFSDGQFDIVHSSAVLEHIGSSENQAKMISECLRVARRGICITTPNRWFPVEFHTQLPLTHWLPKPWCRTIWRNAGYSFFADERNLNLLSATDVRRFMTVHPGYRYRFAPTRLWGWTSNLVILIHKTGMKSEF